MKQSEIINRMEQEILRFKRGYYTLCELESQMNNAISEGLATMPHDTFSEMDAYIAVQKKLMRKMWRMLLDATK